MFKWAPGFEAEGENNFISLALIQEMNTPSDISLEDPPLDEQPYSGVMLLSTGLHSIKDHWAQTWNVRIGAVGPITQVDHTQITYHDWIGAEEPRGWDTQIPNEFIFNVGYMAGTELAGDHDGQGLDWRLTPLVNVELGNYATALGGGMILEFGTHLEKTLGTASLGQGLSSIVATAVEPTDGLEVSAYIALGGYAFAHFLPLDGTTFRDSRSVDHDHYAGLSGAGVTARYKRLIASIGVNFGSTDFKLTDPGLDYGAISVGWVY